MPHKRSPVPAASEADGSKKTPRVLRDTIQSDIETETAIQLRFDGDRVEIWRVMYSMATKLATLRSRLETVRAIKKTDSFLVDKAIVQSNAESRLAVADVLQPGGIVSIQRLKVPASVSPAVTLPADRKTAEIGAFRDLAQQLPTMDRGKATKSGDDTFAALDSDAARHVLAISGVTAGILMKSGTITWSYRDVIPMEEALHGMRFRTPQQTFVSNDVLTFDRNQREIRSTVGISASVGASGWGVSVAGEIAGSDTTANLTKGSTAYTYSELTVPKVQLQLANEPVNPDCLADLEWFNGKDGRSFEHFERLRRFFEDWGAYLPIETIVGGKLFMTDEKTVSSIQDAKKFERSAKLAFKHAVVEGSATFASTRSTATEDENHARTAMLQAVGGDPGLVHDPSQWAASLGSYRNWRPCRVDRMKPLYQFASRAAQTGIYNTLRFWGQLWRTDQLMLDFDQYLYPLAREQALHLLPERDNVTAVTIDRAETRRPAIVSNSLGNLIVAERGGYLVLKPSRPWNHPLCTQRPIKLRCSPLVVSSVDGMRATIIMVHGDERTLARFDVSLDKVSPDPVWQWKITAHVDSHSGVIGQPVLLGGKPPADTIGAFAVRWSNGIAIYGVKADGTFKDLFDGHRYDPGCTYSGSFSGFFDLAGTVNLLLPTSPITNAFHTPGQQWGSRKLDVGRPTGTLAALETWHQHDDKPKQTFHVLSPSGGSQLRYFRGLDTWKYEDVPTGMRDFEMMVDGDRVILLGRVGQELQAFSIDMDKGVGKVRSPKQPFASGITGNPYLFLDARADGTQQVAAAVYAESNKVLMLWYDHGTDDWSILPS